MVINRQTSLLIDLRDSFKSLSYVFVPLDFKPLLWKSRSDTSTLRLIFIKYDIVIQAGIYRPFIDAYKV